MRKNLVLSKHSMGTLILQRDLVLYVKLAYGRVPCRLHYFTSKALSVTLYRRFYDLLDIRALITHSLLNHLESAGTQIPRDHFLATIAFPRPFSWFHYWFIACYLNTKQRLYFGAISSQTISMIPWVLSMSKKNRHTLR